MMMAVAVVVLDTCVLISFAQVHRFDILQDLAGVEFLTTEHVLEEITDEKQREEIELQIRSGLISIQKLINPATIQMYFEMRRYIGPGEASCIALAIENNWIVGSDDKKKVPGLVSEHIGDNHLITTKQLLRRAIDQVIIDSEEAEDIQRTLEQISRERIEEMLT